MDQEVVFSTPMMQQYMQLKAEYPDCLLWFRLGDFYEMFLEQAETGSEVLGITLTSRSRGKDGRIPMAGIPYHAAESYLAKLIQAGYRVAICEQVSQPDGKNLVDRKVVRIVTPGTILDERNLEAKTNNYIACLVANQTITVAVVDISTGELKTGVWPLTEPLLPLLKQIKEKYPISEWLLSPEHSHDIDLTQLLTKNSECLLTTPAWWHEWLELRKESNAQELLTHYIEYTQQSQVLHLQPPQPILPKNFLQLDEPTVINLELFQTLHHGQKVGSLLHVLDSTLTPMGGRLLKQWVRQPLSTKLEINHRLDQVENFVERASLRQELSEKLKKIKDIERILARLSLGVGNPRDVQNLANSLTQSLAANETLSQTHASFFSQTDTQTASSISSLIQNTLHDQPPIDPKIGGIIKDGINPELDRLRNIVSQSQQVLSNIEIQERQKTGITSLKIKYNQVFGYYIEISKANLHLTPKEYFRKQTLVNAERFITEELKQQEEIILTAEEKISTLEFELFQKLVSSILKKTSTIQSLAHSVAKLDCIVSLAEIAVRNNYTKPLIIETGVLSLKQSRHPVVEQLIPYQQFIPNDIKLDMKRNQILLLTGPNMAGKSVLMRQVALITLMAHLESFVPSEHAEITLTDQIFVRSGASDMITSGLSTFMVEMVETAAILKHATRKSLVVMDEIGRGTSTYDGISIAWAIAEYLIKTGCKTLFATHYHELQALSQKYPDCIRNFHMSVSEHQGKPVFLYTLKQGGASHSFGVAVAELAGLPSEVIIKAKTFLQDLEHRSNQLTHSPAPTTKENLVKESDDLTHNLRYELSQVSIEHLTPLSALNLLADWKQKLNA